ncbi:MAG TPA: hypothetical protein VK363_14585 [Pyrinomonadaceae bacterium]|nr:hypothetical protein [Pyrinomonadaceae bacterium]
MQTLRARIKFGTRFFALTVMLFISMSVGGTTQAQTTIVNYDFNTATASPVAPTTTAPGVTSSGTSSETFATPTAGTTTTAAAFTQNTTAGNAFHMTNSSGTNTKYFQFQLGGEALPDYVSYKVYFQARRSPTGAQLVTLAYSINGTAFTNFATMAPGNDTFNAALFDLSSVTALNNKNSITFRLLASGASGTGSLRIDNFQVQAVNSPIPLKISEFRLSGPSGTCDEFIEIYNASDTTYTAQASDNSPGMSVAASPGTLLFVIPNGTLILPRAHYLGVNTGTSGACTGQSGFSGALYPSETSSTPTVGDASYASVDVAVNTGLALFSSTTAFTEANRLDSVGAVGESNPLYVEGTGYPTIINFLSNSYSLFRDLSGGQPKDTGNNESDFRIANTIGSTMCNDTANFNPCNRLGAPGPQNRAGPVQRNDVIKASLIDTQCTGMRVNPPALTPSACRFERNTTPAPNAAFGTISIRRRFTNTTQQTVTRLRFRIVDITTFPDGPGNTVAGDPRNLLADLRALTSMQVSAVCQSEDGTPHLCSDTSSPTTTIEGTTLETDMNDQPFGGGLNSTLSLATPLAGGASVNVQFLLGVQGNGRFRFFVNVEALPTPAAAAAAAANTKARALSKAARTGKGDN